MMETKNPKTGHRDKDVNRMGGKDLWNAWVLCLEWKSEGVMNGENDDDRVDELACVYMWLRGYMWNKIVLK